MTLPRKIIWACLAAAGLGGYAWNRLLGPVFLQRSEHNIPLLRKNSGKTIRILHLSDFHASKFVPFSLIAAAVNLALSCDPDVICLTGDFITFRVCRPPIYKRILRRLSGFAPTFACLGNHDGGGWSQKGLGYDEQPHVLRLLTESGITCLANQAAAIVLKGIPFNFVGLGDLWAHQLNPEKAFDSSGLHPEAIRIVLAHNPDTKKIIGSYPWDLLLSGHTHGGQVILPYFGAPYLPVEDRRYIHGLHRWHDRYLHITRGVGSLFGLRFNCPPEISILSLVSA